MVPWTWWPHEEVGHTDEARKEIQEIFGMQTAFTTPKPVRLIERVLQICCGPNDLVLDFFAGSDTTAHAALKLNSEDGGARRCILVSNSEATPDEPDKNLCRDVCAERVRRVIGGYRNRDGAEVPGLGGDFAYLRTRRIAPGRLLEIEHPQVWTALQLMHFETLTPWPESGTGFQPVDENDDRLKACPTFLWAGDEDSAVCYVPRFRRADAPALREAVKRSASVALYSWQPQALRQHVRAGQVTHLPIPETLARRFGLHQGAKP